MTAQLQFNVLGPITVRRDGRQLDLGTPKARGVLAILLSRPGRPVTTSALVDELWGEDPPKSAVKNIQVYIHQLRRALGDNGRIVRQDNAYRLIVEPDELDAERFERLTREGRQAGAEGDLDRSARLFREALALWRDDEAYADLFLGRSEPHRLAEARLAVHQEAIDVELRSGRHEKLIPELTELTDRHPLQEGLWARLMTALYRARRPADALQAYERARHVLAEETGLDPGPELRELRQAVLTARPEPVRAATPRTLPADIPDFIGREDELASLVDTLRRGTARVAVSGRGGIGKTVFAVRLAHRVAETFDGGQLYASLGDSRTGDVLSRFLRALGAPVVPADLEERVALYRSLVAERRILVVLDNVADESQVRPLLPGAGRCGVIVTSRARLGGLPGAHLADLETLPDTDGMRLLERIVGVRRTQAEPAAVRELLRLCAGLPLALRVAGASLATRPHWRIEELTARLADESQRLDALRHRDLAVRAGFAVGYQALSPPAARLFRLLGLLDAPDFAEWTAAAVLDRPDVRELLDEVIDARLLDLIDGAEAGRRYRFHDLIRVYARERAEAEESPAARTAALKRAFGGWLALTDACHRAAGDGVYRHTAERWRPDLVVAPGVPTSAMMADCPALVAAVAQCARLGMIELCWQLALGSVPVLQQGNFVTEWRTVQNLAFEVCEDDPRGRAAMWYMLGLLHGWLRRHDDAHACHAEALALFDGLDDRHGSALTLRKLAVHKRVAGHGEEAIALSRRAYRLLLELGDPGAAADALIQIGVVYVDLAEPAAAVQVLTEAIDQARACDAVLVAAQGAYWIAAAYLLLGRYDEAEKCYADLDAFARDVGSRTARSYAHYGNGLLRLLRHDLPGAHAGLGAGLALAREVGDPLMEIRILHGLGLVHLADRHLDPAERCFQRSLDMAVELAIPIWRAYPLDAIGRVHAARGDAGRARTAWRQALTIYRRVGSTRATELADRLDLITCG